MQEEDGGLGLLLFIQTKKTIAYYLSAFFRVSSVLCVENSTVAHTYRLVQDGAFSGTFRFGV